MHDRDYLKIVIPEGIYGVLLIFFLVRLDKLNKELLSRYPDNNWMNVLTHNNNQPAWYFLFAILYVVGAVGLVIYSIYLMRNDYLSLVGNASCLACILINIVEIILIIIFINNPILRAVMAAIAFFCIAGYLMSNSN